MKQVLFLLALFLPTFVYGNTLCFAHRGGGRSYVDNSVSAIRAAIENMFEGIEIDLHQTKDGQIILLHDEDLSEVAIGEQCPLRTPVNEVSYSNIEANCKLKNGEPVARLRNAIELLREKSTLIILDLKDQLTDESIKYILRSGLSPSRLRLTAFYPQFLLPLKTSKVLDDEQIRSWNSILRYENFRHPIFSKTGFNKNFHQFSAYTYAVFGEPDVHFGAWEVNYPIFLRLILPLKPEFIVTKAPLDCMRIRDGL